MTTLPSRYAWLAREGAPRILVEALKEYGTLEVPGEADNAKILAWADEVGGWIAEYYTDDEIPWCGLFMAVIAKRAGYAFNQKALSAAAWADWGVAADKRKPMLGDLLILKRPGGHHITQYVGEDPLAWHGLGGNQQNMVNITRFSKDRELVAVRRCPFKVRPGNIRQIHLAPDGAISRNEA